MIRCVRILVCLIAVFIPGLAVAQSSPEPQKRIALVIGNASYQSSALATPANDAGLIAQTLEAAGFDVIGAKDLDQDSLRRSFRDFLDKAQGSGPNTVAFVYLSGYGLQLEGENYFVPIDARISRPADVVAQAIRISDYTRPLAALGLKASIVVLDVASAYPFTMSSTQMAGGLALAEPEPGILFAYSTAPDTAAPTAQGPYGPYAQALAEMMREGGLPLNEVFERVRLRVNDATKGAQIPWHSSRIETAFVFFERGPDAPPPPVAVEERAAYRVRPIRDFSADDAYMAALERDTISGYLDFLSAYPDHPLAGRVRAIVSARREAITWRRTRSIDTPEAYWSYLSRYPRGRHSAEARSRLAYLRALLEPPPSFTVVDYDVPPPPPEEYVYIERRVLVFDDPVFAFAPPPPPPVIFLAPPPPYFVLPPPPPVAIVAFALPIPVYQPVPLWCRPPVYVAPPPANNIIFNNIHNTVVINSTTNIVTITNRNGQTTTVAPPAPAAGPGARGPAVATVGPSLPPSVAQKVNVPVQPPGQPGAPGQQQPSLPSQQGQPPGQPPAAQPSAPQLGQPLPGTKGLPLPLVTPQVGQPNTKSPTQPPINRKALLPAQPQPRAKDLPPAKQPLVGQPNLKQQGPPASNALPPSKSMGLPKGVQPKSGVPATAQPNQLPGGSPKIGPKPGAPVAKSPVAGQPLNQPLNRPLSKGPSDVGKNIATDQQRQRQQQLELQKRQEQQRIRQLEQQRQQQLSQQRQRQLELQNRQQDQQRQRQIEQQRQQQAAEQRRRQVEQQRQQDVQRQRQLEAQRQQQIAHQRQQELQRQQQQRQQQPKPPPQRKDCGGPQQPACPR